MKSELKKCPFCGGVVDVDMGTIGGIFECQECGAKVYIFQDTEKDTITAWNRRADYIVDLNKKVEFTKEELKYILILAKQNPHIFISPSCLSSVIAKLKDALKGDVCE